MLKYLPFSYVAGLGGILTTLLHNPTNFYSRIKLTVT